MSTPLEDAVLVSYLAKLTEKGLNEDLIKAIGLAFLGEKLPTAEIVAEFIKQHSGQKFA
ncbi:hypothetical protein CLV49_0154 [Labedella gwakjiensis]|uniref:Uncharacterized protein n=1 Tax=Labedella gwakjiensis TaxID=390269 RepID=A0A2P8GRI8_9MICO|nr:hypothetical protein [Labedella gwakjiensis]PSL36562.1 hypothetical protein CLV49_0154 [Labedella gwakjiensis]